MTEPFASLSRRHYMLAQKQEHGRHLLGVFPAQYPREILWAMNILPVEIWDPPLETSQANAHLQPYICSVVKLGLELILQGHCRDLDGFLFPHTCDSIQNMASIVFDYLGVGKPCHFFYHPKAPYQPAASDYYHGQLERLVSRLEKHVGPLDTAELKRRVAQGRRISDRINKLYDLRAAGKLSTSNADFYRTIRMGEFLYPDDFLPVLERFLAASREEPPTGPGVVVSGILPNPAEMLTLLDDLGVRIADDDYLSCSRRLLVPPGQAEDPFEALTQSYFAMPPCSTRGSAIQDRLDWLLGRVERSGARGVIFSMVKFCEPELFDVPQLIEGLKARGIPTVLIDSELNQGVSGQVATRIEAFVEMID